MLNFPFSVLNVRKNFQSMILSWRISQQRLRLFINDSNFFRGAIVNICTCKGDFRKSYFFQRAALSEYLQPQFPFELLQFLGTATVKTIYLKHQIFVKTVDFFKTPLDSCLIFKLECHFIQRKEQRSVIHFFKLYQLFLEDQFEPSILSYRVIFFTEWVQPFIFSEVIWNRQFLTAATC